MLQSKEQEGEGGQAREAPRDGDLHRSMKHISRNMFGLVSSLHPSLPVILGIAGSWERISQGGLSYSCCVSHTPALGICRWMLSEAGYWVSQLLGLTWQALIYSFPKQAGICFLTHLMLSNDRMCSVFLLPLPCCNTSSAVSCVSGLCCKRIVATLSH